MTILLEIHSILRWVIVVVGVVAIIIFLSGMARREEVGRLERGLSAGFSGLMDLQVTLGLLYFFFTGFGGAGFPIYRIEHLVTTLIAAVAGHGPAIFKKASNRHAVAFYSVVVAMILVVIGVYRLPGGWSR